MDTAESIFIGAGERPQNLLLKYANRHGLIAGATGTGKTVTLQILAEGFSRAGVPVFLADVKGDLAGLSQAGTPNPKFAERAAKIGLGDIGYAPSPVVFWDLFGEQGHPVRTTVSEMGPLLLSRLLDLSEAQEGVLSIIFQIADDEGWLLLDLDDLQSLLAFAAENAREIGARYGNVSGASVGAIQRKLLTLRQQGGEHFFGEPALELPELMRTTWDGRGCVNVLAADRLMETPQLYATFLLWLLSELFEELPEVGDPDKPKLVFFFDEAHLLFNDAPKALVDRIESVVRLIRSKGVGIYFVTQNPIDLPDRVLGQLGNRVQHALRAFTPRDQKAVKSAAETFRANPAFDVSTVITELGVGEALVSPLEAKGVPGIVERTLIRPPSSRLGPITPDERREVIGKSPVGSRYDKPVDRESAHEILGRRAEEAARNAARAGNEKGTAKLGPRASNRQTATEAFTKSVVRSIGYAIGRAVVRGVLGSISKGR
ncbi:helicase HerA-like domain-containing protein [Parvibaculum sp.]|uniref:helicase HerA-like domain-containing protein n=1 Tax=Parvibaculum sp. TaxID=2024848 RepID=UPI003919212D